MRVLALVLLATLALAQRAKHLIAIKTLTLHSGRMTAAYRGAPIPQLKCVGGNACGHYVVEVMQCYNQGADDRGEVQWKCQAEMPETYRLGTTTVSCEGFRDPNDDYVVEGSCGVEYTLHADRPQERHTTEPLTLSHAVGIVAALWSVGILFSCGLATITALSCLAVLCGVLCCAICDTSRTDNHDSPPVTRSHGRKRASDPPPPECSASDYNTVHETHHYDSGPGFWTGYALGAVTGSSRTTEHHYHSPAPSETYSAAEYSSPSPSHISTGYGGTKKR